MGLKNTDTKGEQQWVQICKQQWTIEKVSHILIILCFAIGLLFDLMDKHILLVDDFQGVSLTALQIHASISTVSIALVALISGAISEEYYGVSVSNYYLNIKPSIFKQKRIIIAQIGLVSLNVFAHLIGLYNLVIAILWAACILIIVSITELYSAFKGKSYTAFEILNYVKYQLFDKNVDFDTKADVFTGFNRYWPNLNLNKVDYEEAKKLYLYAITALLKSNPVKALRIISKNAATIIKVLATTNDPRKKYRLVEVFEETYFKIWDYIVSNNCLHIEQKFDLYNECCDELVLGMYDLSFDDFQGHVYWEHLVDLICRINIYCHDESQTDLKSLKDSVKSIRWIPSSIGSVLKKMRQQEKNIDLSSWKSVKSFAFSTNHNIPSAVCREYSIIKCQFALAYFRSLLKTCQSDIAIKVFDKYHFGHFGYRNCDYEDILLVLLMLCYTYYISERESLLCISEEEKDSATEVLTEFRNQNLYMEAIHKMAWECEMADMVTLKRDLISSLDDYECMPLDGSCKTCIVEGVTRDVLLLTTVLVSACGGSEEFISNIIAGENVLSWYLPYLGGEHFGETQKRLTHMVDLFVPPSPNSEKMIRHGLETFNSVTLKAYKEQTLTDAHHANEQFLSQNRDNSYIDYLSKKFENHLQEKLAKWVKAPKCHIAEEAPVQIGEITLSVGFLDDRILDEIIPSLETRLLEIIIDRLLRMKKLDIYKRSKNENEDHYYSFLKNSGFTSMVGPGFAFGPYDYRRKTEFDQITAEMNRVHIGVGHQGLLLNCEDFEIGIEKLSISTEHVQLSDCTYEIDEETKLYYYAPTSGVSIPYTKEELEDYLYNEKITLKISVELSMAIPQTKIGYLVKKC